MFGAGKGSSAVCVEAFQTLPLKMAGHVQGGQKLALFTGLAIFIGTKKPRLRFTTPPGTKTVLLHSASLRASHQRRARRTPFHCAAG